MVSGIYQILNLINSKRYIGSSINLTKRLWEHQNTLKKNIHHNRFLQSSYNRHGLENFEFTVIVECSPEHLTFYEDSIIKGYRSNEREFGYNLREVSESNRGMHLKYSPGDKFNRITLLDSIPGTKKWSALCDCGKEWAIEPYHARKGIIKSCGCFNKEMASQLMFRQHADPDWSERNRIRSKETMTITMSKPENKKKASIHIQEINSKRIKASKYG